jgi:V8-like Glu-specific endopeptidase
MIDARAREAHGAREEIKKQAYAEIAKARFAIEDTDKKSNLDLATHFNFVSDGNIIGGNSGSPVVNKAGEFVGNHFRRQHSIARARLHLHRQTSARCLGRFPRDH